MAIVSVRVIEVQEAKKKLSDLSRRPLCAPSWCPAFLHVVVQLAWFIMSYSTPLAINTFSVNASVLEGWRHSSRKPTLCFMR